MDRRLKAFLSLACALLAPVAVACEHVDGTDVCGPELLALLYATAAGPIYVQPTSGWTGVTCAPVSGAYAQLLPSAPNFKQIYALLLSAKLTGNQVRMVMDPMQSQCTITYVTLQ